MKLLYRVLWFEDDEDIVKIDIGPDINKFLKEQGFILEIDHSLSGDKLDELVNSKDYDLILTDLNLGEGHEAGEKLIEQIRDNKIFTEVLLYSGNVDGINRVIKNHDGLIERVSFSVGIKNLTDKIRQVISLNIKKTQDVNNMRGLVMAETSELDEIMLSIIIEFLNFSKGKDQRLQNHIFKMMKSSIKSSSNKIERLKNSSDIFALVIDMMFDSDKKRRAVEKIVELMEQIDLSEINECIGCYSDEIALYRNLLAHVREVTDSSGNIVLKSRKKEYAAINFNEPLCIKIRKDIRKHHNNLNKLLKHVNELSKEEAKPEEMSS